MPLTKTNGNMYDWVTHTWSCLNGACPHDCSYCSTKSKAIIYPNTKKAYSGEPRCNPNDANTKLGGGKKIFVAHTSDLFAEGVPSSCTLQILDQCKRYPLNLFIFQSKNPGRAVDGIFPPHYWFGTTIETDDDELLRQHSRAPDSYHRANGLLQMRYWKNQPQRTFVTIEPIMKFHLHHMLATIELANPNFVNIGADSKNHHLPEPTWDEVMELIDELKSRGIEIREKSNLERLKIVS
jgi:hypothetical protein